MEKPITLIIFETKKAIAEMVQESGLPIYIIEPIIKELYMDLKHMNEQKLYEDTEKYRKECQTDQTDSGCCSYSGKQQSKEDLSNGKTDLCTDSGNEK